MSNKQFLRLFRFYIVIFRGEIIWSDFTHSYKIYGENVEITQKGTFSFFKCQNKMLKTLLTVILYKMNSVPEKHRVFRALLDKKFNLNFNPRCTNNDDLNHLPLANVHLQPKWHNMTGIRLRNMPAICVSFAVQWRSPGVEGGIRMRRRPPVLLTWPVFASANYSRVPSSL